MKTEDEEVASPPANMGQEFSLLVQKAVAIEDTQELWLSVFGLCDQTIHINRLILQVPPISP